MGFPLEILLLVMEASSQQTVARMMRTGSPVLRNHGARMLLQGGVVLATENSILSFAQFLRADPKSRAQHLRDLDIATGELSRGATNMLLWVITCPLLALDTLSLSKAGSVLKSNLPLLEIFLPADQPRGIAKALARLKTVRHLKIGQCDARACTLIKTISSPLKTISVHFPSHSPRNGVEAESRNPILLLAKHSATLEEISGSNFAMHKLHFWYNEVFPSVRKLDATYDAVWYHKTRAHIHAFPNLTHLRLGLSNWGNAKAMHLRSQNRMKLEAEDPRGAWKKLQELRGTVDDVLALGIAFHGPMLRLIETVPPRSHQHVAIILEDLHPTVLAIAVDGVSTLRERMGLLLSGPAAQQIRELEVELVFSDAEGDMDIHTVLNSVATTLAVLPLHRVALTLNYGLLIAPDRTYPTRYGSFCPLDRDFEGPNLGAAQENFRAAIPSLLADITVRLSTDRK